MKFSKSSTNQILKNIRHGVKLTTENIFFAFGIWLLIHFDPTWVKDEDDSMISQWVCLGYWESLGGLASSSLLVIWYHLSFLNATLGLVLSLEVVRLDRNSFSGDVPSNINNLTNVTELHLSNNQLTGPVPDLTGMNLLNYVDLSNNSFDQSSIPPWFSTLQSLTTLWQPWLHQSGFKVASNLAPSLTNLAIVVSSSLLGG